MSVPELPPPLDVWLPPPRGQARTYPCPKHSTRINVTCVFKHGLGFAIGFGLCFFPVSLSFRMLGFTQAHYYSVSGPFSMPAVVLCVILGSVAVNALLCGWFRFYYRAFGLWMVRGVLFAGVASLLLFGLTVVFPGLLPWFYAPEIPRAF